MKDMLSWGLVKLCITYETFVSYLLTSTSIIGPLLPGGEELTAGIVSGKPMPYTKPFLDAAQEAVHSPNLLESTLTLFKHPLFKNAHPTPEHLLPLAVAAAAAEGGQPEDIFVGIDNLAGPRGGLGWGMWRWK